ncbi:MAG: type II toxin-antitoxin system prevent-host-death family antitoxin [Deltaproteobacteria bacterium]|nr:type II toxin-antitoxin system prevent-host-death family antitoxin [Deltaproteobacteria bacterium]
MAKVASIAQVKASLSELLAGVKAGGEILVTDRGRPVARIVPCERNKTELDDLVRSGVARPGRKLDKGFFRRPRPKDPAGRVLSALLAEREEGR